MRKKSTLEDDINKFLEIWGVDDMLDFIRELGSVYELYDVNEDDDWVTNKVGKENESNVRIVRTVYIISRMAEMFSGKLCVTKMNLPLLHKRLEEAALKEAES